MAKNISEFIPGFSGVQEGYATKEVIFKGFTTAGATNVEHGCTGATNYGASAFVFCCDQPIKVHELYIQSSSGESGGVCCCMVGDPAGSGAWIKRTDQPMSTSNCWIFCTHSGGCCQAGNSGRWGCHTYWVDATENRCVNIRGGHCGVTVCNTSAGNLAANEVCHIQTWLGWDWTCKRGNLDEYIACKNCHEQDGARSWNSLGLDSDVNMFKSYYGYIVTNCCGGTGANYCGARQFAYMPGHKCVTGRHYVDVGVIDTDGPGWIATNAFNCLANGTFSSYTSLCTTGISGNGGSRQNGNTCCQGNPGHSGVVTIKWTEV